MGLRNVFARAARSVVLAFGDVPENCTFRKIGYDSTTGQATGSDSVTITGCKVVRQDFVTEKVDNSNILKDDRQYLLPAIYLGGVEPKEDDKLDFGGDEVWTIHIVDTDEAGATHLLHCRKK
jgi:hypothetical protein